MLNPPCVSCNGRVVNSRTRLSLRGCALLCACFVLSVCTNPFGQIVWADIYAIGHFSGTIERFDSQTGVQSTFADLRTYGAGTAGNLSAVVFNNNSREFIVASQADGRLYRVAGPTGNVIGVVDGILGPSGMALDAGGNLYVSEFGTKTIRIFDSSFNQTGSISMPNFGTLNDPLIPDPSGLGFNSSGTLLINTFGLGILAYDVNSGNFQAPFSSVTAVPFAQMAVGGDGRVYSGSIFTNNVFMFGSNGTLAGQITIDGSLLPEPPNGFASPNVTNPGGVAFTEAGDLIIAAMGRTNPTSGADGNQSNGGLFRFDADGNWQQTYATNTTPFAGVVYVSATAVPEPNGGLLLGIGVLAWRLMRRGQRSPKPSV